MAGTGIPRSQYLPTHVCHHHHPPHNSTSRRVRIKSSVRFLHRVCPQSSPRQLPRQRRRRRLKFPSPPQENTKAVSTAPTSSNTVNELKPAKWTSSSLKPFTSPKNLSSNS